MQPIETTHLDLTLVEEHRFARLEAIEWWEQKRLEEARVLVVGAGALGNEVLKNFALMGLRNVVVVDMDRIEKSNLSRSVLFRESDEGAPKAECAARNMQDICPTVEPVALVGNILSDVGLGYFRWAEVVVGALDNREARVFVNSVCAQLDRPWVDGGIEVLQGIVRVFAPPHTACYECTMSQGDWNLINMRRSCSLLARRAMAQRGTPTTSTTASVIGGIQAQEVVKILHGLKSLNGEGFFFDGYAHTSYPITFQVNPECGWHEDTPPVDALDVTSNESLRRIAEYASDKLGGLDALDLSRELVQSLECPSCNKEHEIWQSIETINEEDARCQSCGAELIPSFLHSIEAGSEYLDKSPREIGLPKWDIVWARYGDNYLGVEIAGDNPFTT